MTVDKWNKVLWEGYTLREMNQSVKQNFDSYAFFMDFSGFVVWIPSKL